LVVVDLVAHCLVVVRHVATGSSWLVALLHADGLRELVDVDDGLPLALAVTRAARPRVADGRGAQEAAVRGEVSRGCGVLTPVAVVMPEVVGAFLAGRDAVHQIVRTLVLHVRQQGG